VRASFGAALTIVLCAAAAQAAPDFSQSTKSVDKTTALPGDTLTYSIKVISSGDSTTLTLQDAIPAGTTYVASSTQATIPGAPGNINVPDQNGTSGLVSGVQSPIPLPFSAFGFNVNEIDVTFKVTVNSGTTGQVCNTANVSGGGASFVAATNPCTSIAGPNLGAPELTVKINGNPSNTAPHQASPGDTLQYTMVLANTGAVAATGVHIHVDAPPYTQGLELIAQGDNNATLSIQPGGANGTGQFDLTNLTVPANFQLEVIWQATSFTAAQFQSVGISAAQIDGKTLPEQGQQTFASATTLSDDPATAARNDPTTVVMKFGTKPDFSGFIKSLAGSESRQPGDTLVYTLTIPNDGTAAATNVRLTDNIDPRLLNVTASANNGGTASISNGVLTATWPNPLAAGASDSVTLTATLPTPLANGTTFSNQAFASSTEITTPVASDDPATPAVGDPTVVTIQSAPDLSGITKTVAAAAGNPTHSTPGIHPGDTVEYTITVPNTGTAQARQIVVTDAIDSRLTPVLPIANGGVYANGTITWSLAQTLNPGDTPISLVFDAVVQKPLANGTVLANQASVSAQGVGAQLSDDPTTPAPHDSTKFTVVSAADLTSSTKAVKNLTRTDGSYHGGDQLQFTIQPINAGDEATTATVVTDVLDPNLTFVSAGQGGTYTAGTRTVQWNLTSLGLGSGTALTFIASIAKPIADGTSISNFATFAASELPSNVNTNTVTVTAHSAPDLSGITKVAQLANGQVVAAAVAPGTVLTYVVKVPNAGDANATNVVITDAVDTTDLDQITPANGGTLTGGTITWNLASIATASSATVQFTARVKPATANGTSISNQAQVTSTELTTPQLSDDPSTAAAHDPTIVKVSSLPDLSTSTKTVAVVGQTEPGLVRPGDTLRYTITVINSGTGYADNVVVTDALDANLANAQGSNGVGVTGGALTWTSAAVAALSHVAPGAANAVTLTFTAQVAATATDGTVIKNQGVLTSDETSTAVLTDDPTTAAAHDPTNITVHYPVLTFTKSLRAETPRTDGSIHPGDFVDYTLTVSNSSTFAATSVKIDDVIDPNLDTVSASAGGVVTAAAGATPAHADWTGNTTPALVTVAKGAPVQLVLRARVKPGTANATVVSNQAVLNANETTQPLLSDDPSTAAVGDPTRFSVRAIADLHTSTKTVTNTSRADGTYRPGDTVKYTIAVKNSGDANADHVVVADPLDPALTQPASPNGTVANGSIVWSSSTAPALTSVAPGAEVDLTFTAVIATSATDGQVIANQGTLSFDELGSATPPTTDDPTTAAPDDPTKITITANPHLSHSIKTVTDISAPGGVVRPGDILEYEIHVLNDGSQAATNTVLLDPPPPETTYVAGSTTLNGQAVPDVGGQSALSTGLRVHSARPGTADGTVLVSTGAVPDDTVAAVSFRVRVADGAVAGTQISNQGQLRADRVPQAVTDDPNTPVAGDPTIVVVGNTSLLTAEKSWSLATDVNSNGQADVGDVIQYTIEVDNHGSSAASSVAIDDDLPSGATYVAGSLALNGTALTDASDGDPGSVVGTHVHVAVGTLNAGAHAIATFRMHVDAAGTLSNQAQISAAGGVSLASDGDPSLPGIQPTLTPVGASGRADLSASAKAVLDENGGDVEPGDELTYTITLVNGGGADTTQALVDDTLPPGLTFVTNSATGDGTIAFQPGANGGGLVTSSNVTVRAGGRAQIQFRVKVQPNVALGSTIRNEAGVRVTPSDSRLALPVVVVVGQAQGSSSVAGKVAWDINGDGVVGEGDRPLAGFQVLVRRADVNNGAPVKTLITDSQGNYRANDLPPAGYYLEALSSAGVHFADATAALGGQGGTVAAVDIPVQPGGALVRADRSIISGAKLVLLYDDSEVGQTPPACEVDRTPIAVGVQLLAEGRSLPRAVSPGCLRAGQQAQTTDANGIYRFDLVGGSTTSRQRATSSAFNYRVFVIPGTPVLTFPGSKPAPDAGLATAGPIVPSGDPSISTGARWFQRFTLAPGDVVTNNHIELDSSSMRLVKIATRSTAMIGDLVGYSITLQNPSSQDLLVDANGNGGVHLADVLPAGLRYAAGSARADRLVPVPTTPSTTSTAGSATATGVQPAATRHCPLISQDSQGTNCAAAKQGPKLPETGKAGQATVGANLDFGAYDLRAGESLELRYQAVVLTSAVPGDAINSAVARAGGVNVSNSDSAIVRIAQDPLFDLSSLVGKVYCENDEQGRASYHQDDGELGVPGVRIYEDEGWFAETDATGKFHFRGLQPGMHRFKIDVRTLPPGDVPFDDGSITTNLTAGLDARGNFPIACHRQVVGPDRVSLRVVAPPPVPKRTVLADANSLEVKVDGVPLMLPRGSLRLLAAESRELQRDDVVEIDPAAPQAPLRFEPLLAGGPVPNSWRATLTDPAGALLGETLAAGAPPDVIEIAPIGPLAIGTTIRAQLELTGDAGRFISPFVPLRVIAQVPPPEVAASFLLRGLLFEEQSATPTRELARQLAKPIGAAKAQPDLIVDVEVHTASTGVPDEEHVLSDQRARAVREALLAAGIAPERIHARGRGSDVPLAINVTEMARQQNRRIAIQLLKPRAPLPAPDAVKTDALSTLDGKPVAVDPTKPVLEIPHGTTASLVMQQTDGTRAEFTVPKEPLATPPLPAALRLESAARTLALGASTFAVPLLGLTVEPIVDGAPSTRVLTDAGGLPRALAFALHAPVDDVVSWRLTVDSPDGDEAAELQGEGPPPRRLAWPEGKTIASGLLRARLSVRTRGGGEGRSPLASFIAAAPPEPVLRSTMPAAALFTNREKKLSTDGLAAAKDIAGKLVLAAGEDGRVLVDVFTDDASDSQAVADARAAELKRALIEDGVPEAAINVRPRGAVLPIAPNTSSGGRRANNRVVFAALAAEKTIPEAEAMPPSSRIGEAVLHTDGDNFNGELNSIPARLPIDVRLSSGASATTQLELPFAPATGPALVARPAAHGPMVFSIKGGSAKAATGAPPAAADLGSSSATRAAAAVQGAQAKQAPSSGAPSAPAVAVFAPLADAPPAIYTATSAAGPASPLAARDGTLLPSLTLPSAPATAPSAPAANGAPSSASVSGAAGAPGATGPIVGTQTIPPAPNMKTVPMSEVPAASAPLAAHLTADLPAAGTLVRSEALWVRGTTDPHNKLTLNGATVKLDAQGNYVVRVPLRRGDQTVSLVSTDPNGESATIERQVHVNPDGLFVLLIGEGDFGQSGAALDGVGDRVDFGGGVFLKGRAAGVIEGRWDLSQKLSGIIKDVQLSGNFDTARRDAPDAFVELYDPSRYYPVDGDSGLFGQQAASQGPVYLNIKVDESHLIIGNFKTEGPSPTEQLFRFDRTLYGIDLNFQKSVAIAGAGKPGLDSKIDLFGADGDLRQHHAHGELRGTGGSIYWLKDSDIIAGSDQVSLVVRDANTGVVLTTVQQTRDVDYTIEPTEGRIIFKQAVPSVADASFLANANYTTALGGHPIFVVVDYDYRGTAGNGGHAGGAHIQETLFGVLTAGGGVASENYSGASAYTLASVNLGYKPKPHTFVSVELAKSSGTDAESYSSVDGGLTFGSLSPSCQNATTDIYACNASGRAIRIDAGFELADWIRPAQPGGTPKVGTATAPVGGPPPMPVPSGMPGAPAVGPGDLLRANFYFDARDQGFYNSGGDMDQGATKAGLLLRWTPDAFTQITGRVDQVASDVALAYDDVDGYTTKRVLRRFSGLQAMRTLGDPGTLAGRFTLTGEIDDVFTKDSQLGSTFADQAVFGALFRATPKLNFSLYEQGTWNADASQYPAWGDRISTTLGASYKLSDKLFLDLAETVLWSGNNSTTFGLRSPLFSPQSNVYANERFNETAGALQATTVVGAEERVGAGTRMYGEYQLDNQASAAAQRAVMGLQNRWEIQPGLFASVGFERAQVIAGIGADLGGGFNGDGATIPGAAPGATLGGITGQSPIAGTSLNPVATCVPGTTNATGTAPVAGAASTCSSASGLSYNPAGAYYPGTTVRDSGSVSIEYLASERFKLSAKGELRLDQADQRLVGTTPGVADRLHFLVSVDVSSKWSQDLGSFARVHIAQTQAQNVIDPGGPQLTEARWVELTAGLTYRPVNTDWFAMMFKATHLIDLRPLDLTSGIGDEQTSDIVAISPTVELPWHFGIAEKLAYKHTRDVLADGPALDTSTWLWVNRLDVHLHKMVDFSAEYRVLVLRGPSSGAVGVGGDGESGVLLEAAFKPSRYARIGVGWNFTSFSDDELARYDHTAGGFFIRAIGEY